MRPGPAAAEARRGRPPGARPASSRRGARARDLRAHPGRPEAAARQDDRGDQGARAGQAAQAGSGHPAAAAHQGRHACQACQAHPEARGAAEAEALPGPSDRGRPASWRHGEHRPEAYRRVHQADSRPPADSRHPAAAAHQEDQAAAAFRAPARPRPPRSPPGHPDPRAPQGRVPTRAAWARNRPPEYPAPRAPTAEASHPAAHPAPQGHPAEAAWSHPRPAHAPAAESPCWWRRPRCPRRSERAAARPYPARPTAATHWRDHRNRPNQRDQQPRPPPADTRTAAHPARAEAYCPAAPPARQERHPAPADSRTPDQKNQQARKPRPRERPDDPPPA